jgi:hypothetical protein
MCSPALNTHAGQSRANQEREMKTARKTLGQYGLHGGTEVYTVSIVRGHTAEIRRLWARLDHVGDGPEAAAIIRRLSQIGAAMTAE